MRYLYPFIKNLYSVKVYAEFFDEDSANECINDLYIPGAKAIINGYEDVTELMIKLKMNKQELTAFLAYFSDWCKEYNGELKYYELVT